MGCQELPLSHAEPEGTRVRMLWWGRWHAPAWPYEEQMRDAPCGHHGHILLACKTIWRYGLFSLLCSQKTALVLARLARRFFCIVLVHLLLLSTVRMTWRSLPRCLTRGISREY